MDARRVRRKSNHPNSSEHQEEVYDDSDRLSSLPDDICGRILSLLPVRHAVRTRVLSRRWEFLWTAMPELKFTESQFVGKSSWDYSEFIERVLALRDHRSPIRVFSLNFNVGGKGSRVNTWIAMAIWRGVQVLDLILTHPDPFYPLPDCVFRCETLAKLHLDLDLDATLRIPPFVHLPRLKVMSLARVKFADHTSVEKLLSQPLLEKLSIGNSCLKNLKAVRISAPKLRELRLENNQENDCRVLIEGGRLKDFNYSGDLMNEYTIIGSSLELVQSEISVPREGKAVDNGHKILRSLSSVKNLSLSRKFLKTIGLHANSEELLDALPEFNNMTEMQVKMVPIPLEWVSLLGILRRSPLLQSLRLTLELGMHCQDEMFRLDEPDPVPLCFATQLKMIEVLMPWSHEVNESRMVHMARILLGKAMVLEEMILECPLVVWRYTFFLKIKELPRGSKKCRIALVNREVGKLMLDGNMFKNG